MAISPDTDTAVWREVGTRGNGISAGYGLRVGGTQIDADGWAGHYSGGFCGRRSAGADVGGVYVCIR
jgi:hypothetical protein